MDSAHIVRLAVPAAAIALTATVAMQFVDYGAFDLRYQALDSNTHASLSGVASLTATLLTVVSATLLAITRRTPELVLLPILVGLLLFLRVWHPANVILLSLPLAGLALATLWRQGGEQRPGAWMIRAGCMLLIASFAIHAIELVSIFGNPNHSWGFEIRCAVKHALELSGWILVGAGLLCLRPAGFAGARDPEGVVAQVSVQTAETSPRAR